MVEGSAAWYKTLQSQLRATFGTSAIKWVVQPSDAYNAANPGIQDEWIFQIKDRADVAELVSDMISIEAADLGFIEDINFSTAAPVTRTLMGNSQHKNLAESLERQIAIACATSTSWYNWFGSFRGAGQEPDILSITEVSPALQLIRWIPNQDNIILDGLSTSTTRFVGNDNGTVSYYSVDTNEGSRTNSSINSHAYWGRDHRNKNRTIYACFLANSNMGTVTLPASDGIVRVWSVNNYFEKDADITSQFTLTNNVLQPISTFSVDTGSGTGAIIETGQKGRMYSEY